MYCRKIKKGNEKRVLRKRIEWRYVGQDEKLNQLKSRDFKKGKFLEERTTRSTHNREKEQAREQTKPQLCH